MKKYYSFLFLSFITLALWAQKPQVKEIKINKYVHGDLYQPADSADQLVIIVAGSGPTDRDGNQSMVKSDAYKKLAHYLADHNIACFTYDKRILRMNEIEINEADLRFEDFVTDLKTVVRHFEETDQYDDIVIAGHSQGSLIGLIAMQEVGDAFISIAGPGEPIDSILVKQISKQAPGLKDQTKDAFQELRKTGKVEDYPKELFSLLRPQIQLFIKSWMMYDPRELIKKTEKPILIINGDQDLQVDVDQAKKLKEAQPNAKLVIIKNMNHVLKESKAKDLANQQTYQKPELPLVDDLKNEVLRFVESL